MLRIAEDYDLWLRMANAGGRFDYTHRILGQYRRLGAGISSSALPMVDAVLEVLDKCERTLALSDAERSTLIE